MTPAITEHVVRTQRHTTFYLAAGPADGPLIIFAHGWPELSISWRHQLPALAALGFRCLAPDMRGYGRSTVHPQLDDYNQPDIVQDMLELLDSQKRPKAVWVGHDWGSPVIWNLATHHPERCLGVANLCVPHLPLGFTGRSVLPLINRDIYPEAQFPAGQWEYQLFYQENFERAHTVFEANVRNTVKALFRKGDPSGRGKPSRLAYVRKQGGWFNGADAAPDVPMDADVLTLADLEAYTAALTRNGFRGPDAWYMNHDANATYGERAVNGGRLDMPVLFLHGAYDYTCDTVDSKLAEPMRAACSHLTEVVINSGHWMAQEQPVAVNAALVHWLASKVPGAWPKT